MKFLKFTVAMFAAGILLTSCGTSEPNHLFETASPETSMMSIYVYDGTSTTCYRISDNPAEEEMLAKLANTSAVPAEVTTKDVELPVYGFEIGTTDGWGLNMAWSNGYLYNRDGAVYEFDFDFGGLLEDYSFEKADEWDSVLVLPCARYLAEDADGWNAELMSPVMKETAVQEGITLEIDYDGEKIDAVFWNYGTEDWSFGTSYSVQVNLDGIWYYVPTDPVTNWAFNSIGYVLEAGGDWEETYSLNMYGDLPAGLYRFVAYGLTAEFTIE